MPLYEYKCKRCGTVCEVLQKFGEEPPSACLKCGGALRKLLTSAAIQFKGGGWYVTDYSRKNGNGGRDHDAAKPKDAEAEPAAKSEPPKPDPSSSAD